MIVRSLLYESFVFIDCWILDSSSFVHSSLDSMAEWGKNGAKLIREKQVASPVIP